MIIPQELFDRLCPSYKKVIEELEDQIAKSETSKIKYDLISNFARKYLMPKQYYDKCFVYRASSEMGWLCCDTKMVKYQFYYNHHLNSPWVSYTKRNNVPSKILQFNYHEMVRFHECHLTYPHSHLRQCWQRFVERSTKSISKQHYQTQKEMLKLYYQIRENEDDVKEWFKLLCTTNDDTFIRHNAMYRLGEDFSDETLWNLYIDYLRKYDPKEMLQVYSRYCRFFLDDLDMKEEYRKATEEFGPSIVPWKILFDFEQSPAEIQKSQICSTNMNFAWTAPSPPALFDPKILNGFYETFHRQTFPFRKPLMSYIFENANHDVLKKLQQTCKYFFLIKPVPLCYKLDFVRCKSPDDESIEPNFQDETIKLKFRNENFVCPENIHVTTVLNGFLHGISRLFVSNLIPKLYKCDAKYIILHMQVLSFNELKFLIKSGNVIYLNFNDVVIKKSETEFVPFEDIMKLLPNIEYLKLSPVQVTSNTATALLNQQFCNKISAMKLSNINGEKFECQDFMEFVKKNQEKWFILYMCFGDNFSKEYAGQLYILMAEYVKNAKHTSFYLRGKNFELYC